MKKKVIIAIVAVLVAAALSVSLWFVFSGLGEKNKSEKPNMTGVWTIAAMYTDNTPQYIDNQYIVFTDSVLNMYKDSAVFANSTYHIDDALNLVAEDISRKYVCSVQSTNCIRLYETTSQYLLLIRNNDEDLSNDNVTTENLQGKWNIALKGNQVNNGETLEFTGNRLNYYKADQNTPFASADIQISSDSTITAPTLNLTFKCYQVSDSQVVMIENTGYVWEIHKDS